MKYQTYLSVARRQIRLQRTARGLLISFCLVTAIGALLYAVSCWTENGGLAQSILGLIFIVIVLASLIQYVLFPLFRQISDVTLIQQIEKLHPEFHERFSTAHYLYLHQREVESFNFCLLRII